VALQGTIDAFPLVDVLHLLAASRKTGRLDVDGERGRATLWVVDGQLAGGRAPGGPVDDPVQLVFEVLRFGEGSFLFDASGTAPEDPVGPLGIPEVLDAARSMLEEWATIAKVLPSPQHRIRLVAEPSETPVTLTVTEWTTVVAVGDAPELSVLAGRLGTGEFEAGRRAVTLVTRGLAAVEEPVAAGRAVPGTGSGPERELEPELTTFDRLEPLAVDPLLDGDEPESYPERFPIDDLLGDDGAASDPWASLDDAPADRLPAAQDLDVDEDPFGDAEDGAFVRASFDADPFPSDPPPAGPSDPDPFPADPVRADPGPWSRSEGLDGTDEVLRQMSRLSPKAAEAIAAALGAGADAEDPPARGDGPPFAAG
jgi:hypothetical protein